MFCKERLTVNQTLVRSALVGLLLLSGMALADTDETRSRTVTKPVKTAAPVPETARADAATSANSPKLPNASAIRSVKVSKDYNRGGLVLATIELDGQAQYNYFTLPSPYRLVLDVQNVASEVPSLIQVGMPDLRRIRLGKMDDSIRLVFDAVRPQPFEITAEDQIIRIWFGEPKIASPAPTLANNPASRVPTPVVKPTPAPTSTQAAALAPQTTKTAPVAPLITNGSAPAPLAPRSAPTNVSKTSLAVAEPTLKPTPITLPPSPKLPAKAMSFRLLRASVALRPMPKALTKAMLVKKAKSDDVPPPPKVKATPKSAPVVANRGRRLAQTPVTIAPTTTSSEPQVAAQIAPQEMAKQSTPAAARRRRPGSRVVAATPVPIATPLNAPAATPQTVAAAHVSEKSATEKPAAVIAKSDTPPAPVAPAVTPTTPRPTETPRETTQTPANPQTKTFNAADYARPGFEGEPINLDLRSTQGKVIDIRDFLRFISDTYKVNFVIDQSVREIPITVTLQNVPWNQAMDALLRANRLGVKVEGAILRVMSQETVTLEDKLRQEQTKAREDATPLVTEMMRLNYARALTSGGGGGGASSAASSSSSASGASTSGAGSTSGGSGLDGIIRSRLSSRGAIQADPRTNTLIITDVPENVAAIKDIIAKLDVPEPQVEIESRIVIANRNFARDLGVQLGGVAVNTNRGGLGSFGTLPGGGSSSSGSGNNSGVNANTNPFGIPTGLSGGGQPQDSLRAAGASSILGLTTGLLGTAQISLLLTAAESKGNVKTISSPRVTAQNNTTANIVNGVQIPVQTESNNTLTVTFVTAALRLEITPQINDSGNVLLKVVAENNSVNTAIATRSAPGINTQRAETTVLVPDGGTTIIGGINIDVESNSQQRTPGVSRVPGLGELFKRRTVSRQTDEILFFITPRIYRPLGAPSITGPGPQK